MPIIEWKDILACLEVEAVSGGAYTAPNIPMPYRRIFGGQLLAQLVAVSEAATVGKQVKSLHVAFPREGDLATPVVFDVEEVHTGRSFATRSVRTHQAGSVIAQAVVSLHTPESSALAHQTLRPPATRVEEAAEVDLGMIPWETRAVGGVDLGSREVGPAESAFYMRTPGIGRDTSAAHRALLAHATDLTVIGTALRPHEGLSEADSPDHVQTAVTTHTIFFQADDLRVDAWWLLVQSSPVLVGARGHGRGDVFDATGRLCASFAQESLIRPVA